MSWAELDDDDDDLYTGRTPRPEELPSLVREHTRVLRAHGRQHRAIQRLVLTVIGGSLSVVVAIATAAVWLGARMERLESVADRVGRLERITLEERITER